MCKTPTLIPFLSFNELFKKAYNKVILITVFSHNLLPSLFCQAFSGPEIWKVARIEYQQKIAMGDFCEVFSEKKMCISIFLNMWIDIEYNVT